MACPMSLQLLFEGKKYDQYHDLEEAYLILFNSTFHGYTLGNYELLQLFLSMDRLTKKRIIELEMAIKGLFPVLCRSTI